MRAFRELTASGQFRRLRRLAIAALRAWGLESSRVVALDHGENTTFRVDVPVPSQPSGRQARKRYLLRVCRPFYQTDAALRSELQWLEAIAEETDVVASRPVRTKRGELFVEQEARGVPEARRCVLFEWVDGRFRVRGRLAPAAERVGRLTAKLHQHALEWPLPDGFERPRWDADGLVGRNAAWGCVDDYADRMPAEAAAKLISGRERVWSSLEALGEPPDWFGLIHADLHPGNVLHAGSEARPIDFDDSGHGYFLYDAAVSIGHFLDRPKVARAYLRGYRSQRPLPDAVWQLLPLFVLARRLNIVAWVHTRADNPSIAAHQEASVTRALSTFERFAAALE